MKQEDFLSDAERQKIDKIKEKISKSKSEEEMKKLLTEMTIVFEKARLRSFRKQFNRN
ncbi:hypothetical protein [Alkalihalobacillus sp. BA299]|uniref:hypothetical protein n=1 Tax=Alkalihalobacillus sp. BA299 TaxID=2815938 RepID=UPI001ADBE18F|nr:hypothetical protein [Alkalihalobacillus sp. BA299]